jgi:hypothetical protein
VRVCSADRQKEQDIPGRDEEGGMSDRIVKIGAGTAFVNDSIIGMQQLLAQGDMDYIVLEYLAEGVMAWLAADQVVDPASGFSPYLADVHVGPNLAAILAQGVKIVTNAGGLNPRGSAESLRKAAAALGLNPRIAVVEGDDLRGQVDSFRDSVREMYSGEAFPEKVTSASAYLGAFPIAAALAKGADIVITGRVVDSALALGPLIHEFGWTPADFDALAGGTAVGHLLECGAQATGGTFTDWRDVKGWENIGFPIAECRADGSFVLTKPKDTGGLVSVGTVSEQLIYEVQDPQAYMVPDVACDFGVATVEQVGPDRVRVANVKGRPPTSTYKVSATFPEGWRTIVNFAIFGLDATAKARRTGEAMLARTREILRSWNLPDWSDTAVELLGAESTYGAHAADLPTREVICRMVVRHPDRRAAEMFGLEARSIATTMGQGSTNLGQSQTAPVLRLFSFLLEKDQVKVTVTLDGESEVVPIAVAGGFDPKAVVRPGGPAAPDPATLTDTVPLLGLAWTRSGDKADMFNLGVIARKPEYLPFLRAALTEEAVGAWYSHVFADPANRRIVRYDLPGFHGLNFNVFNALHGGQTTGMRADPNAKGMGLQLAAFPVPVTPAVGAEARARLQAMQVAIPGFEPKPAKALEPAS